MDADGQRTSSSWLESLENEILFRVLQNPDELLDQLPKLAKEYEWVLVDGPATLSETTRAPLLWADLALIPCQKPDADPEATPEQVLVGRMLEITKQLKKSKAWTERKKHDRITKLLDELERLT